MWTDDHLPPTPTRSGRRGRRSNTSGRSSSRTIPYIGEADVRLGMYDPPSGKRLALNAPEASRREYMVDEVPDPGLVREHLLDHEGRLAPGGKRRQEPAERVAVDEEDRDALVQEPEEGLDVLPPSTTPGSDLFKPPQQVGLKIGDQERRAVRRRREDARS